MKGLTIIDNCYMAKIRRFVTLTTWEWREAELTEEQLVEYKAYQNDETGEIEEPEWVEELEFKLVRDKCPADEYEDELIED